MYSSAFRIELNQNLLHLANNLDASARSCYEAFLLYQLPLSSFVVITEKKMARVDHISLVGLLVDGFLFPLRAIHRFYYAVFIRLSMPVRLFLSHIPVSSLIHPHQNPSFLVCIEGRAYIVRYLELKEYR